MNRNEYIQQRAAIDEAAKEIALDLIHDQFPDVEWTPTGKCKLWQNGTLARLNPEHDENAPAAGGLFEVNFLTGSVLYVGADFSKMTTAALNNPTAYAVEQRGETAVFTVWRGSEAAVAVRERRAYRQYCFPGNPGGRTGSLHQAGTEEDPPGNGGRMSAPVLALVVIGAFTVTNWLFRIIDAIEK